MPPRTTLAATLARSLARFTIPGPRACFGSQTPAAARALWITWLQLFVYAFQVYPELRAASFTWLRWSTTAPIAGRPSGSRTPYTPRANVRAKSVPIECRTMNSSAVMPIGRSRASASSTRMPANQPAAAARALAATPVVLRDRRYLDVVGKQRVVDALLVHGAQGTGQGAEKYTDASRSPEPFVRCSETTTWYGTFWS